MVSEKERSFARQLSTSILGTREARKKEEEETRLKEQRD
jgi:hypothetical protein